MEDAIRFKVNGRYQAVTREQAIELVDQLNEAIKATEKPKGRVLDVRDIVVPVRLY